MNSISLEIAELLNKKLKQYKVLDFIKEDPITVPHLFTNLYDIEIAGFLTALISWGNRKSIIQSGIRLMKLLNHQPYYFVMNYSKTDDKILRQFYYRTFQPSDSIFYIRSLNHYYKKYDSLEEVFKKRSILDGIAELRTSLLQVRHVKRNEKHLPDVKKESAAKRINMFLRWMVRKDNIDFGLWKSISPSDLLIPLDVHTVRTSYSLGLLKSNKAHLQNVIHLTSLLKTLDEKDPVKYDFALFGIGRYEKKNKTIEIF